MSLLFIYRGCRKVHTNLIIWNNWYLIVSVELGQAPAHICHKMNKHFEQPWLWGHYDDLTNRNSHAGVSQGCTLKKKQKALYPQIWSWWFKECTFSQKTTLLAMISSISLQYSPAEALQVRREKHIHQVLCSPPRMYLYLLQICKFSYQFCFKHLKYSLQEN